MNRVYGDATQFTELFRQLFDRMGRDDAPALDDLAKRRMVVQFRVREPDVEMWVDGRSAQVGVSFGPTDLRPTFAVELTADTLHELLLGTLPLGKALSSRRLRVQGSKLKAMRLQALFHAIQSVYPGLAADVLGDRQ